ncbi:MAG: hypothetical protein R2838_25375 [Caldilineaceae bacterium]
MVSSNSKMLAIISFAVLKLVFLLADMHQETQTVISEEDAFGHRLIIAGKPCERVLINEDTPQEASAR